jgi:U3 small nucleolar ribonucleoprotein protein LCP5
MSSNSASAASLLETSQKVQAALLPSIEAHLASEEFSKGDGLDFLDVKNGLMLSYLIDLVTYIRDNSRGEKPSTKSIERLNEMKVVLDKMRGLDKKLRYQIDKLLAANISASEYAMGGDNPNTSEDPLQFRPDPKALDDDDSDEDQSVEGVERGVKPDRSDNGAAEADADLAAARATLSLAKTKKSGKREEEDEDDGIYRAPRTTAVPYAFDQEQKQKEKDRRSRHRMRATELAQTLRAQYGEAPEQEDIHGGSDYGKQRAAARRLAEREDEKTKYEEDAMVRLGTSRKDKKEKRRLMRDEGSNLAAIADLGNLVRETKAFGRYGDNSDEEDMPKLPVDSAPKRYENGKRRRDEEIVDGPGNGRRGQTGNTRNSLQAALYNTEGKGKGKKKKSRR